MENESIKVLPFKSISEVTKESLSYIDARRKHIITPLKTQWKKFNRVCCGGVEPNMIFTIAGGSGSGKRYSNFCRLYEESYRVLSSKYGENCDVNPVVNN